jgi:hypothetical protein
LYLKKKKEEKFEVYFTCYAYSVVLGASTFLNAIKIVSTMWKPKMPTLIQV